MRLHTLRLHGISEAFPNEVCVDFDALGPGLIALVGENGAGKAKLDCRRSVPIRSPVAEKFLAKLSESKNADPETVDQLRKLFAEGKKVKAEDLVRILNSGKPHATRSKYKAWTVFLAGGALPTDSLAGAVPHYGMARKANRGNEMRVRSFQRAKVRWFSRGSFREGCSPDFWCGSRSSMSAAASSTFCLFVVVSAVLLPS